MSIIKAKFDESACIINRLRLKWNGEVQQMNLAKRMAYLKKRDGLTTEMLSQRSGVATGTLNKLLNGATRRPALETMERVARAFGVPVRYFTDAAVLGIRGGRICGGTGDVCHQRPGAGHAGDAAGA